MKSICIGLGDLLITRLLFDVNNIEEEICINTRVIKTSRNNSKDAHIFTKYIVEKLFAKAVFKDYPVTQFHHYIKHLKLNRKQTNLKKYFDLRPILNEKYLVFHTKSRFGSGIKIDYIKLRESIEKFCKTFKSKYTIVLIGDKKIHDTSYNGAKNIRTQFGIFTIYNQLLFLKNNNKVIDMTCDDLVASPGQESFERDVRIISNSECSIGIGWGGNFSMTWAVSEKFCFFIDNLSHPIFSLYNNGTQLHRNKENFFKYILENFSLT